MSTKAVLRWPVARSPSLPAAVRKRFLELYRRRVTARGELVLASQRFRSRSQNVADCVEKLRRMLGRAASPPRERKPTRPTRASAERRLREKRIRAGRKRLRGSPAPSELAD